MKISYDAEVDALYIRLLEGRHECRCVRLSDEVALNIGAGEKLVGIEVLDAREVLGSGRIPAVLLEGLESATAPLALRENPPGNYSSPSETPPSTKSLKMICARLRFLTKRFLRQYQKPGNEDLLGHLRADPGLCDEAKAARHDPLSFTVNMKDFSRMTTLPLAIPSEHPPVQPGL